MQAILFRKCIIRLHLVDIEKEAERLYTAQNFLFTVCQNRDLKAVSLSPALSQLAHINASWH